MIKLQNNFVNRKLKKMHEFELIDYFFASIDSHRKDVVLGIGDDAALLEVPPGKLLVDTTDTLVKKVHFSSDTPPNAVGYKSLAVNLSDLAAMGATPCWVGLSVTLPTFNKSWLTEFCQGFSGLLKKFNLQLIGGDTTRGPLSITVHVLGTIDPANILRRNTAKAGDAIYVTGTLGDAAFALHQLKIKQTPDKALLNRLYYPTPRVIEGAQLGGIANAAIDISDGLLADLNHILKQSHVGALIFPEKLPLSETLQQNNRLDIATHYALTGGDDYELCITVEPSKESLLKTTLEALNCRYTCIGVIESNEGIYLQTQKGRKKVNKLRGYRHF